MINSSDLIYNTNMELENNSNSSQWLISRYLNLKPSDYSFERQLLELNLYSYTYDIGNNNNNKIFNKISKPNAQIFTDLLPLFSYTTLTLRIKNSNKYILSEEPLGPG